MRSALFGTPNLCLDASRSTKSDVIEPPFQFPPSEYETRFTLYRATYLNSYLVGEGMSGLVPGVIALAQGVGGNPYCENVTDANGTTSEVTVVPEARFRRRHPGAKSIATRWR